MKFGAKLLEAVNISQFTQIIATIGRLTARNVTDKSCVLKLTPEQMFFILPEFAATATSGSHSALGRTSFWMSLEAKSIFEFYVCEGKPDDDLQVILLEIQPENLLRALKSTTGSMKMVRIKLTKRQLPCITVEIDLHSVSARNHSRTITHDIPVKVISSTRASLDDFREPDVSRTALSIHMPPLKLVKHMIERMKCLSEFVTLEASGRGELQFRIDADAVAVCSYFRGLPTLPIPGHEQEADPDRRCTVRLSLKRLFDFINSLQFQPTKIICNFADHKYAHFFVIHDDNVVLQFLLSSVLN